MTGMGFSAGARAWSDNALHRLYERANSEPQYRFDDLENLTRDTHMLAVAADHVADGGPTAGVDGLCPSVMDGDQGAPILAALENDLRTGQYRPDALRRAFIVRAGKRRPIAIPTVRDRVAQVGAAWVVEAVVEPRFSDSSHGFRPWRGPLTAISSLCDIVTERPDAFTIRLDIERAFESVEHERLLRIFRQHIVDPRLVRRVRQWLRARVASGKHARVMRRGLAMGMPIAPLLFNIFMTPFDRFLERNGLLFVRYADDIVIVAECNKVMAANLLAEAAAFLQQELGLAVSREKTSVSAVSAGLGFLGLRLDLVGDDVQVRPSDAALERINKRLQRAADELGESSDFQMLSEAVANMNAIVQPRRAYFGCGGDEQLLAIAAALLERHIEKFGLELDISHQGKFVLGDAPNTQPPERAEEPVRCGRSEYFSALMRKPNRIGRDRNSGAINRKATGSLPHEAAPGRGESQGESLGQSPTPGSPSNNTEIMMSNGENTREGNHTREQASAEAEIPALPPLDLADGETLVQLYQQRESLHSRFAEELTQVKQVLVTVCSTKQTCAAVLRAEAKRSGIKSDADLRDALLMSPDFQALIKTEAEAERREIVLANKIERVAREAAMISRTIEVRKQEIQLHGRGFGNGGGRRAR